MDAGEQCLETGNEPSQYPYLVAEVDIPIPGHKKGF
jgi:hypothetical protein